MINAINKCCSFLQICLQNTKLFIQVLYRTKKNSNIYPSKYYTQNIQTWCTSNDRTHRFEQNNQPLSISDTETKRSQYFNRQPLYAILSKIIHIVLQFNQRYLLVLHDTNLFGKKITNS